MSAKERPQSTDVQSDPKKYAEGWERIFGKKSNDVCRHCGHREDFDTSYEGPYLLLSCKKCSKEQ